jgi:hypothetical protein
MQTLKAISPPKRNTLDLAGADYLSNKPPKSNSPKADWLCYKTCEDVSSISNCSQEKYW